PVSVREVRVPRRKQGIVRKQDGALGAPGEVLTTVQLVGDPVDALALDDRELRAAGCLAGAEKHGLGGCHLGWGRSRGIDLRAAASTESIVIGNFGTTRRTYLSR